jgi:hypothetical protein
MAYVRRCYGSWAGPPVPRTFADRPVKAAGGRLVDVTGQIEEDTRAESRREGGLAPSHRSDWGDIALKALLDASVLQPQPTTHADPNFHQSLSGVPKVGTPGRRNHEGLCS